MRNRIIVIILFAVLGWGLAQGDDWIFRAVFSNLALQSGPSINSTSANGPAGSQPVPLQPMMQLPGFSLLAANDLGMHCADQDFQVMSILPPFNVMHAQVIQRGRGDDARILGPDDVEVVYSAGASADDPSNSKPTAQEQGTDVFKSNFWEINPATGNSWGFDGYDPLYPTGVLSGFSQSVDTGLPSPDNHALHLGPDGIPGSGDEYLTATQQVMPGIGGAYVRNDPQPFARFDDSLPFFIDFPFGYMVNRARWFSAEGVPLFSVDDQGRENPYPLSRVQAIAKAGNSMGLDAGTVLATLEIVTPISAEADCQNCHATFGEGLSNGEASDFASVRKYKDGQTPWPIASMDDVTVPGPQKLLNAAKLNILRLHDAKHGDRYTSSIDGSSTPCMNGTESSCLGNRTPVQCSWCHYSPALDLAQLGPVDETDHGPNGRQQTRHSSMSRVMHGHHGQFAELFPDMPAPGGRDPQVANDILTKTCYSCHPGKRTQCLRGAMAKAGVQCQDCHGQMRHVGNDFSEYLTQAGFPAGANLNKRVPWATEPRCDACHVGDALENLKDTATVPVAEDGIRLLQAWHLAEGKDAAGNPDGSEVVINNTPANHRFGQDKPLFRLSHGHGGVMCEACHGSTHAVYPNPKPNANDNVAANQLQGHVGTIRECTVCHEGNLGNTMEGPHGMHPVGDTRFARGGHEELAEHNSGQCAACHGANGEGSVLSVAAVERTLECKDSRGSLCSGGEHQPAVITQGTPVSCGLCHRNYLSNGSQGGGEGGGGEGDHDDDDEHDYGEDGDN